MNMIEMLAAKVSPEQEALHAATRKRWQDGMAAGEAGLPRPENADPMAYKSGIAKRRSAAGEIIGFIAQACRCKKCGEGNYYWRMGCRCWPEGGFNAERNKREGYAMEYGYQVDPGSDPAAPEAVFMTDERLRELAKAGREVIDVLTGEPVIDRAKEPSASSRIAGQEKKE